MAPADPIEPALPADDVGNTMATATMLHVPRPGTILESPWKTEAYYQLDPRDISRESFDKQVAYYDLTFNDVDFFRITLDKTYNLTVVSLGDTDTYGVLMDQDGTALFENDNGYRANFKVYGHKLAPGTYYIKVTGAHGAMGYYRMGVAIREYQEGGS